MSGDDDGAALSRPEWRAWGVVMVSFGRFGRFFRDGLGCLDALFFVGTVSSLRDPGTRRRNASCVFDPIVAVFEKSSQAE